MSNFRQRQWYSLTPKMKTAIVKGFDKRLRGDQILESLKATYGKQAPSRTTVYNFLRELRNRQKSGSFDQDRRWSLGAMADYEDLDWQDAALILRVQRRVDDKRETLLVEQLREGHELDREDELDWLRGYAMPLTHARWVARLGRIAPKAELLDLYVAADLYASHERLCLATGVEFDTRPFDEWIDPDSDCPLGLPLTLAGVRLSEEVRQMVLELAGQDRKERTREEQEWLDKFWGKVHRDFVDLGLIHETECESAGDES